MRIYNNCTDMLEETYREIWKRGQTIFDKTVQGRIVSEVDFEQKELLFYNYRVDNFDDLPQMLTLARKMFKKEHLTMEVAEMWFNDMISNPTLKEKWWDATLYTKDYYAKFCAEKDGNASYSYGERIIPQLQATIDRLKQNKYARGAIITMLDSEDAQRVGRRIPCTISYHFVCRPTVFGDRLNLILNQRSADAITFFPLDFAKAVLFLKYMGQQTNIPIGYIIHSIDTLHVYKQDVPRNYQW